MEGARAADRDVSPYSVCNDCAGLIEAEHVQDVEANDDAAGEPQHQSTDIDDRGDLVAEEASPGHGPIAF
jgi:hypothetical protein